MKVIDRQLSEVKNKSQLSKEDWLKIVIAYEPVWAIGTGKMGNNVYLM